MPHATRQPGGYVLLMTLVLLALAAVAMTTVSRHSAMRAVEALEAQRELQLRWGVKSCREVVLPQAERLLDEAITPWGETPAHASTMIELGGQRFGLIATDEQAKVNINLLHDRDEQSGVLNAPRRIRELLLNTGTTGLDVRLRPIRTSNTTVPTNANPQADVNSGATFVSYGQVFDTPTPEQLVDVNRATSGLLGTGGGGGGGAAHAFTCWGDGRLNIRRSSAVQAAIVCDGVLDRSQLHNLIETVQEMTTAVESGLDAEITPSSTQPDSNASRSENNAGLLDRALAKLDLERETLHQIKALLTAESHCHGLWIVADDAKVKRYHLYVEESQSTGPDRAPGIRSRSGRRADSPPSEPGRASNGNTTTLHRFEW